MTNTGVVLIAGGHPNYGKMAVALACAIDVPVTIFSYGNALNHLSEDERKLFDVQFLYPRNIYDKGRLNYLKAKTFLYDLSPYDNNLYLDVDVICTPHKKISALIESLKDVDFAMISEGVYNMATGEDNINRKYVQWADIDIIKSVYPSTGKLHQLRSEVIWFKKSDKMKTYFDKVKDIYGNDKLEIKERFGMEPDEHAFAIASMLLECYPLSGFNPIYWEYLHKNIHKEPRDIYENYYLISMGGSITSEKQRSIYNALASNYYNNKNLKQPFQFGKGKDKKYWKTENVLS